MIPIRSSSQKDLSWADISFSVGSLTPVHSHYAGCQGRERRSLSFANLAWDCSSYCSFYCCDWGSIGCGWLRHHEGSGVSSSTDVQDVRRRKRQTVFTLYITVYTGYVQEGYKTLEDLCSRDPSRRLPRCPPWPLTKTCLPCHWQKSGKRRGREPAVS